MNHPSPSGGVHKELLIVADDLTGALDTAGCFASPDDPVHVLLELPGPISGRGAIDTDSRDLSEKEAVRRVAGRFELERGRDTGRTVFKKIDSVMRGHPVAESVAAFRAGKFDRVLLAPAFPAMGRITFQGRQYVVTPSGRTPVGPKLVAALSARGVPASTLGDKPFGRGFFVADAATQAELASAVETFGPGGRALYVGTAGLAAALVGGSKRFRTAPPIDLAICGTRHPVTLAQAEAVDKRKIGRFVLDDRGDPIPDRPSVLIAPEAPFEREEATAMIARSLERVVKERDRPGSVLVTGGQTLRLVCRICRVERLLCSGLHAPGTPLSLMVGGLWDGTIVVSKSGGFGSRQLLRELFAARPLPLS